jgi:hypothetical protein
MGTAHPSYELVKQAEKGEIRNIYMHWREHPVYAVGLHRIDTGTRKVYHVDQTYDFGNYPYQMDGVFEWHSPWFDKERKRYGNDQNVKEMLEIDYEGSGFTFFDHSMINEYIAVHATPPTIEGDLIFDPYTGKPDQFVRQQGGPIKLWTELLANRPPPVYYTAGADTSLGVGTTPSCLTVGRIDTGEKVLEYVTADLDPKAFAIAVVAICRWMSNPNMNVFLSWEVQGPGTTFGEKVIELGYSSVYIPPASESKFSKRPGETPGFKPTVGNKRSLLLLYQTALANRDFLNHSGEALKECYQFMQTPKGPVNKRTLNKSPDPSGATENHGDRVIADALCYKMMVERGGGNYSREKDKPKIKPGMFEWYVQEADRKEKSSRELYGEPRRELYPASRIS